MDNDKRDEFYAARGKISDNYAYMGQAAWGARGEMTATRRK
jgi:hypothetical protein